MTLTIIGVTGLTGSQLYELAKADPLITTIRLIVRRPFAHNDSKTAIKLVDFEDAESFKLAIEGSDVLCCTVGTTQKKVKGDKEAYRKVDFDIPVKAARFAKETGCENFVLISAVGAGSQSNNFYLRLKGEVEDAVKASGLTSVTILQPSVLLGPRQEKRFGERIAQVFMQTFSFLIPSKYKPVHAKEVAAAMLRAAKNKVPGVSVLTYKNIMQKN